VAKLSSSHRQNARNAIGMNTFMYITSTSKPIDSYNKSQHEEPFVKFIFVKNSTDILSIIRSLSTVFTATGICHTSYA